VLGVVAFVVVLLLVDAVVLWSRVESFPLDATGSPPGGTTYLLIGSDNRDFVRTKADRDRYGGSDQTPGQRADVVIALRVRDDGRRRMLIVSRDLLVLGKDAGLIRLAETMLHGEQPLVDALCRSIGLGVDHVVVIDLGGLRNVVNALGGIDLTLDTPVRDADSGLDLAAGKLHIDGDQVLSYVGSRHLEHYAAGRWRVEADSEERPERAAQVLRIVGGDVKDATTSDPFMVQRVLWAASGGMSFDDGLGVTDANALRTAFDDLGDVKSVELPVTTSGSAQLPIDQLDDGAGKVLADFDGKASKKCSKPSFPAARRPAG
jgi:LCP family protein required for cell wall assembly